MKLIYALSVLILMSGCGSSQKSADADQAAAAKPLPTTLEEAVNSSFRTEENRARDIYRHPLETLQFFGLQSNMTVVEVSPGAGWYTEILAPYLAANGQFIAATPPIGDSPYLKTLNEKYTAWLNRHPEVGSKVTLSVFDPGQAEIAPAGTADMILTFRNVHNWMSRGTEKAAFASFYKALKPGGVLGVVEHRAPARQKKDPKAKSGYVRESDVVRMAQQAGFKLESKSEVNANPKDTKNYAEGVWTLPPTLRLGEKDRERYLAIGESDRMTLKFIKPAK